MLIKLPPDEFMICLFVGWGQESSLLDFSVVLNRSKKEGTHKHLLKYSFDSVREHDVILQDLLSLSLLFIFSIRNVAFWDPTVNSVL